MNIISTSTASQFSSSVSQGLISIIDSIWPIFIAILILGFGFVIVTKLVDVIKFSVKDVKEEKEKFSDGKELNYFMQTPAQERAIERKVAEEMKNIV